MKHNEEILLGIAGLGLSFVILSRIAGAFSYPTYRLLLSGTYLGYGNIYSPEIDIANNKMYFGGWYNNSDYPDDAIYVTDLNNLSNVKKIIQIPGKQVNDPTIVNNKMYMTHSPDPSDLTQQYIAFSTTNDNGITWSIPSQLIQHAWLPSAIQTNKLYIYYTSSYSTELLRAEINITNQIVETKSVIFEESGFYPINIDIKYYNNKYYLLGDYWTLIDNKPVYCIGLWISLDGINFLEYYNNPIIVPSDNNIIARTPYFIKEDNKLRIWYAQQKQDWWTNAIYYTEYTL